MNILVVNAGSSSLKCGLFTNAGSQENLLSRWQAQLDWSESSPHMLTVETDGKAVWREEMTHKDHLQATKVLLSRLWSGKGAVLTGPDEVDAIGHRVVHGGTRYFEPVLITDEVVAELRRLIELAPAHEPVNIEGIKVAREVFPKRPQVAVFDTAFHHSMPEKSVVYAVPYRWYHEQGLRRFGFHGISHEFCAHRAAELLKRDFASLRIITCHLGNGASLCAVKNGQCRMTTMGYTPLDGLVMGTRSGSIDPGLIIHLLQHHASSGQAVVATSES